MQAVAQTVVIKALKAKLSHAQIGTLNLMLNDANLAKEGFKVTD
jgi:hypothetical protein